MVAALVWLTDMELVGRDTLRHDENRLGLGMMQCAGKMAVRIRRRTTKA